MLLPVNLIDLAPFLVSVPPGRDRFAAARALLIGPRSTEAGEQRRVHDALSRAAQRDGSPSDELVARLVRLFAQKRGATESQTAAFEDWMTPLLDRYAESTERPSAQAMKHFLAAFDETDLSTARLAVKLREVGQVSDLLRTQLQAGNRDGFQRGLLQTPLAGTRTVEFASKVVAQDAEMRIATAAVFILTLLYILTCVADYRARLGKPFHALELVPEHRPNRKIARPMRRWMEKAQEAMGLSTAQEAAMALLLPRGEKMSRDSLSWDSCWKDAKHYRSWTPRSSKVPRPDKLWLMAERAGERFENARRQLEALARLHWAICLLENMLRCSEALSGTTSGYDPLMPFEDLSMLRVIAGSE